MRPTPRTDAFKRARQKLSSEPDVLTMEYARTLERELAEAVELLKQCNAVMESVDVELLAFGIGRHEAAETYWYLGDELLANVHAFLKRMEGK